MNSDLAVKNTTLLPNQHLVTEEEYERIAGDQLAELWSNYGDLDEVSLSGAFERSGAELGGVENRREIYEPLLKPSRFGSMAVTRKTLKFEID